ncbi:MAG: prolyl oligopeptidase family serine peptidase [Burkholderiaceae bacterium]|nr:prolyl oligopeptidase family serine peptidase [Burkholderiaceae bacterium]
MRLGAIATCLGLVTAAASALAQPQGALPVDAFVALPEYSQVEASRNGRALIARVPVNGRLNLAVIDLESMTRRVLTSYTDRDVIAVDFAGNERIVYRTSIADREDEDVEGNFALHMVTRDGARRVTLFDPEKEAGPAGSRVGRSMRLSRLLPASEAEVLVTANLRDPLSLDIYRVNLDTGQRTLMTETRPEGIVRYVYDRARVARAAVSAVRGTTTKVVHVRASETAPWLEVGRYDMTKPGTIEPLAFTADGRRLRVATNASGERMAMHYFDPDSRRVLQEIFAHSSGDVGSDARGGSNHMVTVSIDSETEEVRGYLVRDAKPRVVWNTEDDRRFQRLLDRFLPDTYNRATSLRRNTYLVDAVSPTWPTTWHVIREQDGKAEIEDLFASRSALLPDKLQLLRPFDLKARDGLVLPSYYLLPKGGKPGDRLPTVVLLHDAPSDRLGPTGHGATLRTAQLLAARGYAVVLPTLRGTLGFGNRVYYAGFGAMGRQAIDDVADAAAWAAKEGISDPARVCVAGTGFGGYGALMALARAPQAFRCGAVSAPVADLSLYLTSERSSISAYPNRVAYWSALAGAASPGTIAADRSPVTLVAQIKQPLWVHWAPSLSDVPLEQATRLADALAQAGNAPTRVITDRTEAASNPLPRRVEQYTSLVDFLDQQIGARRAK